MGFILILFLTQLCLALPHRYFTDYVREQVSLPKDAKVGFFDNKVDHFDLASLKTYQQRYWFIDDHWDKANGPAVLFIQGEAPGTYFAGRPVPLQLAKDLKGIFFALEHRYYGISQPCSNWTLPCLKYLTHDQAMADIAAFIVTKTKEMGNPKRKWLLIGGSYAGALVVWFKARYPHLADVVYSSSGVVNVIEDYSQYMRQINIDLEEDRLCLNAVKNMNQFAIDIIRRGRPLEKKYLKLVMNANKLSDIDFLNYITEIYLGEIQYSNRKRACTKIKEIAKIAEILPRLTRYAEYGVSLGVKPEDYILTKERSIVIDPGSSSRQWIYQVCTAYGWFATGIGYNSSIRPIEIDLKYFHNICQRIFDFDLQPNVNYTNGMLGDLKVPPLLKHVVMVNGKDDPWKWAGYLNEQDSTGDFMVKVIDCDDCAHCLDLSGDKPSDPEPLREARANIRKKILQWMTQGTEGTLKIGY